MYHTSVYTVGVKILTLLIIDIKINSLECSKTSSKLVVKLLMNFTNFLLKKCFLTKKEYS